MAGPPLLCATEATGLGGALAHIVASAYYYESWHPDLLKAGNDIRTIQELMGHKDVRTTMIYTHVSSKGGRGV